MTNKLKEGCVSRRAHPHNAIRVAGDDDVLRVPLVHLRHAAAEDLLAAAGEGVGAGDGAAVDAPHVNVGARAGHDVPLCKHKHTSFHRAARKRSHMLLPQFLCFTCDGGQTYRQFIDTQSRDGRSVPPELCDEGELVEVPDDASSIP